MRSPRLLAGLLLTLGLLCAGPGATAEPARPHVERATTSANPLVGHRWGVYLGDADQAWAPFLASTGSTRSMLGRILAQPKAQWFGRWIPDGAIAGKVDKYIANATGGDPDVLVQMSVFRMDPWEDEACRRLPTAAEQASYKTWIDHFAGAVGSTYAAIVLQPDGPFALCAPGKSKLPSHLVAYAAKVLSALPHTSVYIDAGAADWLRSDPKQALKILVPGGIRYARGFALASTHYDSTSDEIRFGAAVARALAAKGYADRHFVLDTADNGRPFPGYEYGQDHPGGNFDNAETCRTRTQQRCVTLGIPPTTDVASTRWGLSSSDRALAASYADGYLWIGRPWLFEQNSPFDLNRAVAVARTAPYSSLLDRSVAALEALLGGVVSGLLGH